jgi:hypothetical protein
MKITQNNNGMSEIIGTVLLLGIAVLVMSVIYLQFLTDDGPTPETHVNIAGDIINENVILTHKGGESLGVDDEIKFTIGDTLYINKTGDILIDENNNSKWDFGEKVLFDFKVNLSRLDDYEFIDVTGIDSLSNSIIFQGPVYTKYRSDIGIDVIVNNSYPTQNQTISITISVWCYGGDVEGAGNVSINCSLPDGLFFINSTADQGYYDNVSGVWHLGNLLVENSPVNLTIIAQVNAISYHEPTQFGIIFEGSEYTSGSVSVWQNTYLSGLRFALRDETIFPHDGSVELTVITSGGISPPLAEVELEPTIITEDNYDNIAQGFRNTPYPGGYSPISSAIRLVTDKIYNSDEYQKEKRQIIIIVTSGSPDCIWDETTGNGYGGIYTTNKSEAEADTINAVEYLNTTIDFNKQNDELNAITVAKVVELRNSSFFNESIVLPKPGNIYDINNPISDPGWVYEVEPGKDAFQDAISLIIKMLLNSIRIQVTLEGSSTIDPNNNNDIGIINIQPAFI